MQQKGGRLIAVCVDPPAQTRATIERNKLPFAILSDPQAGVIRAYGVLHERGGPGGTDIALPAQFLIDRSGRIVWRYVADKVNHRPIPGDIIRRINELP